jgi:hypothetical protein
MKQKDHKALGKYLLDSVGTGRLWHRTWHRRVFLLGCISPDYIPFTYLRGFRKSRAMLGHNEQYSDKHIQKSIRRLERRGIRRFRDCFALGSLMHYLADSFTFPHTEGFLGDMHAHRAYEKELHTYFSNYLQKAAAQPLPTACIAERLSDFLHSGRCEYEHGERTLERDCRQIIQACTGVFQTLCYVEQR